MYLEKLNELVENKPITRIMYVKQLLSKTAHMFTYKNLPTSLPAEEIEYILQTEGEGVVAEHEGMPFMYRASRTGLPDVYGNHHKFLITSVPHNRNDEVDTAVNCVHWKNDSQCLGLIYQTLRYSEFVAEGDITIKKAMINARTPYILSANDKDEYDSALKFLKDVEAGKNAVIMSNSMINMQGVDTKQWNLNGASSTLEILEAMKTMKSEFYSDLGVNINDNLKRSYVNRDDLDAQNDASMHFLVNMLYQRKKAVERINEMFNLEIEVSVNELWTGGVQNEGKTEDVREEDGVVQESKIETEENQETVETVETNETVEEETVEDDSNNTEQESENILEDIYDEVIETVEDIKEETEALTGEAVEDVETTEEDDEEENEDKEVNEDE